MTYYHIQDGEWVAVRRSGWRHQCCDCGAVHDLAARNRQGRLEIRFRINRRAILSRSWTTSFASLVARKSSWRVVGFAKQTADAFGRKTDGALTTTTFDDHSRLSA